LPPRSWVNSAAHDQLVALLVAEREAAGLTQRELAERLRKDPATIARIETGERNVSVLELMLIARALGRDPTTMISALERRLPKDFSA
jgi:transcriptional regulator with XRE-family HTH domain